MYVNLQKKLLQRFYLSYGIGALVLYALLMTFVFPWWQAANHPVILTVGAPPGSRMELVFSSEEDSLPLVPVGKKNGYHWYWGTELPPRPSYQLALAFPEGTTGEVVLSEVKIINLSPKREETTLGLLELGALPPESFRMRPHPDGWGITAEPGAIVPLPDLPATPLGKWLRDWFMATAGFILIVGMGLLLVVSALRFPDGLRSHSRSIPVIETFALLGCVLIGSLLHLHLVGRSMPDYWPADSTSYAMKTVSLVTESSYDTGTHEYELNRMPGFPVFMAVVFALFGWSLNAVTLVQGVFFCLSVLILALSLRRLIHGYLIGAAAFAALISPAAVWASRQIATESTFASFWLLALAAFIFTWQQKKAWRWTGWIVFGLCATATVAIRPNGILLYALPGFLWIGTLWWCISYQGTRFWRIPIFWQTSAQVAIPCAMVVLFLGAWSWRNYESRGYGKPTDLTEIVYANAPFFAGIFDIRAAKNPEEYAWFVNERANSGYWFHGWSLRKYRFRVLTDEYTRIEDSSIGDLDRELAGFNQASRGLIPLRARLAAWWRVAGWGLFFPQIGAYTMDPLNQNYAVAVSFPNEQREEHIRKNLKWATRNVDQTIEIETAHSDRLIYLYNTTLVPLYPWIYRILFVGSLLGWLFAMAERKYLAAALFTPFLLNILLNIYFLYIIGRYVQVLDASLWMALLAGFACISPNTLQRPVTEDDRRCIPPIKPKRLLTRFANEPGTPR